MKHLLSRQFLFYIIKFGALFCVFYFGSLLIIGLSSEENNYSHFVAQYLDFIKPLRNSILIGAKLFLQVFNYISYLDDDYTLLLKGGKGVRMVYSCVGYGVISFWFAFVIANKGSVYSKFKWALFGFFVLWLLNVLRVSLLLIAVNSNKQIPFGMDHHTLYNIFAYGFIFLMMYIYDHYKKSKHNQII
jgi:exosortase/archaeosortase family protein